MLLLVILAAGPLVGSTPDPRLNQDLSAQFAAVVHDVLQPYAATGSADTSSAVKRATEILKNNHLLGESRPSVPQNDLIQQYSKPLALGARGPQFAADIAQVHNAFLRGDLDAVRAGIGQLAKNAGRSEPDEQTLSKMVDQLKEVEAGEEKPIEHATIERPDSSVDVTWDKTTGKVSVDVIDRKGADGSPTRTTFTGSATAQAGAGGKSLEVSGKPSSDKPQQTTVAQEKDLRDKVEGDWIDQDGNTWKISANGAAATATQIRGNHPVPYEGRFELGKLTGQHIVNDAADIGESLPGEVKQTLAQQYHPPYKIVLNANEDGDKLDGSWISLHVTYSSLTNKVQKVADPYDTRLTLTRQTKVADSGTALGMRDKDKP